ncbi:Uncharacterized conserved protein YlxW, UPF0749 family [Tindallia magadiensis]|uniref:Uncharacterized conserved protein YlxW, UPF0749 family n=1 Tax=Tindallia magadiensis TaxID=69895 RepID=A0A1I3B7U3_9FIRM|nr:DUF881 domain-containing protein [Tindallia magadiensis]SFH58136.1 Uncharacterized conserved protein YlxW, UPF0749 family [Tindallia magadiensis]
MKKKQPYMLMLLFFVISGILLGANMDSNKHLEDQDPLMTTDNTGNIQEIEDLKKVNEDMRQRIKGLREEIQTLEMERADGNLAIQKLMGEIAEYQMLSGHQEVEGAGIQIRIEGMFEENIAELMERRRYMVTLVNELRANGAEVISINGNRITARSEMTLAGNHIQVNGNPIAPPYEVKAIGNQQEFQRYFDHRTFLFQLMKGDGIVVSVDFSDHLVIERPSREKVVQFMEANIN